MTLREHLERAYLDDWLGHIMLLISMASLGLVVGMLT